MSTTSSPGVKMGIPPPKQSGLVTGRTETSSPSASPCSTRSTFTVAEGGYFNYSLATHGGDVYGSTTHNAPWMRALLEASIVAVQDEYGVSP